MLTITSRENPQIKHICALTSAAKKRRKEGQFVCEGFTLLEEALRRGLEPLAVYCLDTQAHRLPKLNCPCALVNQSVLEKISEVPAPQGVVFTLPLPEPQKTLSGSRFLALDSLRDPGNMGTILRTADAFRLDGVILLGDCVDAYSPKVVRSAMGSLFSTRLYAMTAQELRQQLDGLGVPLYAATLAADSRPVTELDLKRACVIIGNEAHGVSPETIACCTGSVIVPIQSAESLNAGVAAGILMWEMRR
ncbi:MAG: RNA methyltransferase [Clostridia bacterium]|nr:RNA methyltransferase [Clostridia bacterium]